MNSPKIYGRKKMRVVGFTAEARQKDLERTQERLLSQGWTLASYEDKGLLSALNAYAEFHRLQPATFKQRFVVLAAWLKYPVIIFASVTFLVWLGQDYFEESRLKAGQEQATREAVAAQQLEVAKSHARSLLSLLRQNGVDESLITHVKVDEYGTLVIVVTNAWLEQPAYEQKQMRQTLEMTVKTVTAPKFRDFYLVDYLGNHI